MGVGFMVYGEADVGPWLLSPGGVQKRIWTGFSKDQSESDKEMQGW